MKKLFGIIVSVIITLSVFSFNYIIPAYADNGVIIVSQKTVEVGNSITVMVKYNSNDQLLSVSGNVKYDPKILEYVSGGTASLNDTVTIKENIKNGEKNLAYIITFTAIAPGNNTFTFSMDGNKVNGATSKVSQGATVLVTDTENTTNKNDTNSKTDNDKLAVSVNSKGYKIVNDITQIPEMPDYTRSITKYNDIDVNTLTDVNGKYVLFYLKSEETNESNWFVKDQLDNFSQLKYITFMDKIYIVEETKADDFSAPETWILTEYDITENMKAMCYKSTKTCFSNFRIFQCYYNGDTKFYRYDIENKILQFDPEFVLTTNTKDLKNEKCGPINYYLHLTKDAKLLILFCFAETISVIILIVFLISNHHKRKKNEEKYNDE